MVTTRRACLRAATALAAAVVLASTAACGNDDADLPEPAPAAPTTSPAPAPERELTAEEEAAVDEVRALVDEFLTDYLEIVNEGILAGVTTSLSGRVDVNAWDEAEGNFSNDRRGEGELMWTFVEVVDVDLENVETFGDEDETVGIVRLRYCLDATGWQVVDKSTGKPVEPGELRVMPQPGARHLLAVRGSFFDPSPVEPRDDPRWHIGEWEHEEDQPC